MYNRLLLHSGPGRIALLCVILLTAAISLFSQPVLTAETQNEAPFSFIGMRLGDVIGRFGAPRLVHVSRGDEAFQDDVVFVYDDGDFYIYRDRVWKVALRSIFGIRAGDVKAVALLVLGDNARDEGDYVLYDIPGGVWPVSLRINFSDGRVSAIFVYRPDYH